MSEYIKKTDNYLKDAKFDDIDDYIKEHLLKIEFFQHERLIHLLVTLFYGIVMMIFIFLTCVWIWFGVILAILVVFMIFYIRHYFFLENGVQYMYKQYDKLKGVNK